METRDESKQVSDQVRAQPLRLAFTTPEYVTEDYFDGGLANYIHRVAKALAGMGHDVHVLTLSEIDEAEFEHDGVKVHRVTSGAWWRRRNPLVRSRPGTTLLFLNLSLKIYRKLKWLNSQQPLHLVQVPNYSCCGLVSICLLKVPHVLRASSYQPAWNDAAGVKRKLNLRFMEGLEALQFRLSRHVYSPSFTLRQTLATEARLPNVRVIRTPFYVEIQDWDSSIYDRFLKGKKYLLFFGRFQMHKGFSTLAQALPRILKQLPDSYAVLVGRDMESSLGKSMADYARRQCNGLADRLIIIGKLRHRQLYPVIAGSHLVALPSLIENLPNACLEAMGVGKAVIGTLGTSFEELISEGLTGFLVPPGDPKKLAQKIISAWTDPKLGEMGIAARQKVLEFAPEKTVETLLAYYREILDRGKG